MVHMNFVDSTRQYEAWLSTHMRLDEAGLERKHHEMARDPFRFFRATFYRWAQTWPKVCRELNEAPEVLAVGDLHVENFGTWRDEEGRLVWGVNDFDEACEIPYTNDLVRLATSAKLAIDLDYLQIGYPEACEKILDGYDDTIRKCLREGREKVRPIVLAERNEWLYELALKQVGDPDDFWGKFEDPSKVRNVDEAEIPREVKRAMIDLLPGDVQDLAYLTWNRRHAGLGSLGRQRFVAVAEWKGGKVAREAKSLCPSAWHWAGGREGGPVRYEDALDQAVRCPDPCVRVLRHPDLSGKVEDIWFVRRLSADCIKVELDSVPDRKEDELFHAMGRETANIHIGAGESAVRQVKRDLDRRGGHWLEKAAARMSEETKQEWEEWVEHLGVRAGHHHRNGNGRHH